MRYRPLGATGMQVSTLCLGTMMFGAWGNTDRGDCSKAINLALDAGVNFIDTADIYAKGESEEIVGEAIQTRRDEVVLATKVHGAMGDDVLSQGNSRRWIIKEVDDSLRRLRTDWIDLYQMHRPDPTTDIEETLSALTDLVHAGKVRAIGCSNFAAEQIVESQWASQRRGLERFRTLQPIYSIFQRGIETSILPTAEAYGMGVLVFSPLAGGWLTGRYRTSADVDMNSFRAAWSPDRFDPSRPSTEQKFEIVHSLDAIAKDAGCSLTHLALGFAVAHRAVTSAIVGPRTVEQTADLVSGDDVELDDEILDRIDELVAPGTDLDQARSRGELADTSLRRRAFGTRSVS